MIKVRMSITALCLAFLLTAISATDGQAGEYYLPDGRYIGFVEGRVPYQGDRQALMTGPDCYSGFMLVHSNSDGSTAVDTYAIDFEDLGRGKLRFLPFSINNCAYFEHAAAQCARIT